MKKYRRTTFHTNFAAIGDKAKFFRTLRAWRSDWLFGMNALNGRDPGNIGMETIAVQEEHGGATAYRPYEGAIEARLWRHRSPQEHLNFLASFGTKEVWFNVGNEPVWETDEMTPAQREAEARWMSKWYAQLARLGADQDFRLLVGGFVPYNNDQIEAGWFDELLIEMARLADRRVDGRAQIIFQDHAGYGHVMPPIHCAGRNPLDLLDPEAMQRSNWPKVAEIFDDTPKDNWLLYRDWLLKLRLDKLIEEGKAPRPVHPVEFCWTEAGPENMPHLRTHKNADIRAMCETLDRICGTTTKGLKTITPYLEHIFGRENVTRMKCEIFGWFGETAPECYDFQAAFAWTKHDAPPDRWYTNYDLSEEDEFLEAWPDFVAEQEAAEQPIPVPEPPPVVIIPPLPSADSPLWRDVAAVELRGATKLNIRELPHIDSADIGDIEPGNRIGYIWADKQGDWIRVKKASIRGWAHSGYLVLPENTPTPELAPVPPPETTTPVPPAFLPVLAYATAQEFQEAIEAGEILLKHLQTWLDRAKTAQKEIVS